MRVQTDGIKRHTQPFEFRFDGKTIDAYPGDTIASALIASGILGFCVNRQGEQRGVFCGMGVCGDCRVLIGGRSRRACVEPARENLEVSRYPSRPTALSREPDKKSSRWRELRPDVLIVGAGPAGLSAAKVAAAAGLDVLVVDERHKAGGQYFKQPSDGFDVDFTKVDARFAEGHELMLEVQDAGARFIFGATVWGTFAPNRVAISTDEHTTVIDPRQQQSRDQHRRAHDGDRSAATDSVARRLRANAPGARLDATGLPDCRRGANLVASQPDRRRQARTRRGPRATQHAGRT
jgi:hypothetical protein